MTVEFLKDRATFDVALNKLEQLVHRERRLPAFVFKSEMKLVCVLEFDEFSGPEFLSLLHQLSRTCGDSRAMAIVIEPDPINYFHAHFQRLPAIVFTEFATPDDYFEALGESLGESSADSILHNSEALVWFGDSGEWVLWGERSTGVIILASRRDLDFVSFCRTAKLRVLEGDLLKETLLDGFKSEDLALTWIQEFETNYPSNAS